MTFRRMLPAIAIAVVAAFAPAVRADDYKIDPAHTQAAFAIRHMGISTVHGFFTETEGTFTLDGDKSSFNATIKTDSVDTGQKKRDEHLKSADFFNTKQFPTITFKSTKVATDKDTYEVIGDLTLHGVTKSITLKLTKGGEAEFPKGTHHAGFTSELTLKRSDYNMTNMVGPIADEVQLMISFEGVKQ